MPFLFTTYGLLLIFALFGFAQLRVYKNAVISELLVASNFETMRKQLTKVLTKRAENDYNKFCPKTVQGKDEEAEEEEEFVVEPDSLTEPEEKPNDPKKRLSQLSVNALFCKEDASIHDGKGKACFQLLKALITKMYGDQDFFKTAKKSHPDLEDELITKLIEKCNESLKAGEKPFFAASQLLLIDLEDDTLNYVLYKMMCGSKSLKDKAEYNTPGYYSLNDIISLQGKSDKIMSLWLAPKPLLVALFNSEDVANDVMGARKDMYDERRNQKVVNSSKDSSAASQGTSQGISLESRYASYIYNIDPACIDFVTSTTRPPSV